MLSLTLPLKGKEIRQPRGKLTGNVKFKRFLIRRKIIKIPVQITSRNLELAEVFKEQILDKTEKLDRFYDQIMRCRVVVEVPHRHSARGYFIKCISI